MQIFNRVEFLAIHKKYSRFIHRNIFHWNGTWDTWQLNCCYCWAVQYLEVMCNVFWLKLISDLFCFFIHFFSWKKKKKDQRSRKIHKIMTNDLSRLMTKWTKWVRPAKTQISLSICPVWLVFAVRSMGSLGSKVSSCRQRRLWSDWADAQADLSLHWALNHVGLVTRRLSFG